MSAAAAPASAVDMRARRAADWVEIGTPARIGQMMYAIAIGAMGVESLIRGSVVPALEPVSKSVASHAVFGWVTGIALLAVGLATLFRPTAKQGALGISIVLLLWVLALHLPALAIAPRNGGEWTGAFETIALAGGAVALLGLLMRAGADPGSERVILAGRLMYALSLPVFGVQHFMYNAYVASVIPSWIPAHVAMGYATGVAHFAAGVAIATRLFARAAAYCTALMFGLWFLILHIPRVAANSTNPDEWSSMLIALAMSGAALIVVGTLENPRRAEVRGAV